MYSKLKSYGGVKGRAVYSGTGKRMAAANAAVKAASAAARAAMRVQNARVGGLGPIARQSIRTGGWANPVSGAELKFTDVSVSGQALGLGTNTFTTPGPTFLLNGLVPDSTATGRIGRKIVMKSLYVRWTVNMAATSTLGAPCRIIVVYDKQANAQAPATADVLVADSFLSPNNLSNRDRFVILADEVTEPIGVATGVYTASGVIFKKLNLETMYNAGNAGTIGDITSGSVYILAAQAGAIGTAAPIWSFRSRIRYTDN